MAEYTSTTRRSILKVASIIDASLLTTAITDALEIPLDWVNRLSEKLSKIKKNSEIKFSKFVLIVANTGRVNKVGHELIIKLRLVVGGKNGDTR